MSTIPFLIIASLMPRRNNYYDIYMVGFKNPGEQPINILYEFSSVSLHTVLNHMNLIGYNQTHGV